MHTPRNELTERETDVLRLAASGMGDKLIAAQLGIGRRTVSNHMGVVLLKLDAANRTEAVAIAIRDRLLEPPPRRDDR